MFPLVVIVIVAVVVTTALILQWVNVERILKDDEKE